MICRFDTICRRCFKGTFCKGSEHLWRHVNKDLVDFQMPHNQEMGMPIDLRRTGTHLHMMLYTLDELFYMFQGVGANDIDRQHNIAYEILTVALLCCMEQHGSPKKPCNTLGDAYPRVVLSNMNGLECLAWAMYDGVFVPGDPPALTGHHDWSHIITGTTLHLILHGKIPSEHCEPCTVASFNAKQATRLTQQQGLPWPKRIRPHAASATEAWRAPMVQSVVNVLPQAASSHSTRGVQARSLNFNADIDEEEAFHKSNRYIMMWCSPVKRHLDLTWQTTKWLQACEESLDDEEISWWLLLLPLTDGSDVATRELPKQFLTAWRWVKKVSNTPICPPAPTVLNIGQFLNECPKEGDHMPWLLVYAHALQHVGEATDGRMWWPIRVHFTPQISLLVDVFIQETGAELVEADIASCWGQLLEEVLCQKDKGPFAELISHLDELAQCVPTRKAWDKLIFLPSPAEPCTPCQSRHLGYIMGCSVDLGSALPPLWFCVSSPNGEFICIAQGLLFEGSVLAYDPTNNGAE